MASEMNEVDSAIDCSKVDLELLIKEFDLWEEHAHKMTTNHKLLQAEIYEKKILLEKSKEKDAQARKDITRLNETVDALQAALGKRCDFEDENVHLQQIIENAKLERTSLQKDHAIKISQLKKDQESMRDVHEANLIEIKVSMEEKAIRERLASQKVVSDRDGLVKQLEKRLSDQERDRQGEVMKLRMEYDAKLLKLQKQNAKVQQTTSQMSTANQDIYRKKLQHIKAESEREISTLKRKVSELQTKLDSQPQRQHTVAPLSKKKRY